jgi:hypothetical protein
MSKAPHTELPFAELSTLANSLETLAARIDAIGDSVKGSDKGDQQSAELHLIAGTVNQAQRRLGRMLRR